LVLEDNEDEDEDEDDAGAPNEVKVPSAGPYTESDSLFALSS
jgi:hypothetical protein